MGTINKGFYRRFKRRVQEIVGFGSLGLSKASSSVLKVGFSPTLVISCLRVIQWPLGSALIVGLVQRQFGLCC